MHKPKNKIDCETLRILLEKKSPVFILDIRPSSQRKEWHIPGSFHLDAYDQVKEGVSAVLDGIEIPENIKVITVCAAGKTSEIAADILRKKGIQAYSLEEGMKGWTKAWNIAQKSFEQFEVLQVRRTGKGCLSYIITSGKEAIIVDASLLVNIYKELIIQNGFSVKYVIETHIHADHLSRSKQVADLFRAPLFLPESNKAKFPHNLITEATNFALGSITFRSLPTPGHTIESFSFYIENNIILTGDTLFTNGVGRPDLKADAEESRIKAGLLYESLQKLLSLPDNVLILPAHNSKPVNFDSLMISSTIGEAWKNIPLLNMEESDFISEILQKIPATPDNYLSIVERNLSGHFSETESAELESGANKCSIT